MKQETLEEAAHEYFKRGQLGFEKASDTEEAFLKGAKWMQERMYSGEELKSAFKIGFNIGYGSPVQELDLKNEHCERWFEQFKKK